jgi:hypothetical protein
MLVVVGCAKKAAGPLVAAPDEITSVATQLGQASDSISEALALVHQQQKGASKDLAETLIDLEKDLDDAGVNLGDFAKPSAVKDNAGLQKWRTDAKTGGADALHDLHDAQETLDDAPDGLTQKQSDGLDAVDDDVQDAIDAVDGAMKALN